jgi:hypothetical protein
MQDPTQMAKLMMNYGLPIFIILVLFYKIMLPILRIIAAIIVTSLSVFHNYLLKLLEFSRKKEVKKPKGEELEPGVFLMEDEY